MHILYDAHNLYKVGDIVGQILEQESYKVA